MEHEFKVDSPVVIDRILSRNLGKWSEDLRNEIIPDTTPVPFFGDFENATIASVGINPSRYEFPTVKRRLCHLSDLSLSEDYYRNGLTGMTEDQATKISKSLVQYFESSNNGEPTYLKKWFDLAETAINGAGATYFKNNIKSNILKIACHVDIFPWSTERYGDLNKKVKQEFHRENLKFFVSYLENNLVTELVFLGSTVKSIIEKTFKDNEIKAAFVAEKFPGPNSTFEFGRMLLGDKSLKYFLLSKGPSAHLSQPQKQNIHQAFSDWVKKSRSSL